jgi:phasin family protein
MFTNPEQFANATKTLFDLQMQTFNALANKTVKGVEQVVALNIETAKTSVEETFAATKDASEAKDPRSAFVAMQARMQPNMAEASAYGQQLKTIIDGIQADFKAAADTHMAEAKNTLTALIYDVTQNVKPGSENAVDVIKAAIDNAFKGYEQVTQATRQAVQQVEEQIAKANSMVNPGTGKQGGQGTAAE